jgi:hypothetical protein
MALRADLLVGYRVGKTLETQGAEAPFELASAAGGLSAVAEVGDEAYWHARRGMTSVARQAPLVGRIDVGDRITITGRDRRVRTLEVIGLKPMGAPMVDVVVDGAPVQLMRVICRLVGPNGAGKDRLVSLFVAVEETKPAALPAQQGGLGGT